MAFQDVLDKIANDLIDNTDRLITPAVLRGVLNDLAQWAQDDKVDKVAGKGLSEEDFTTILLNKLNGIEQGAQVNEVSAADLNNYIQKDLGIELDAGKRVKRVDGISLNVLTDTGIYEGLLSTNSDVPDNFIGPRFIVWVLNYSADGSNLVQFALDAAGNNMALRRKLSGSFNDWVYFLNGSDKIELLNKINKLTIEDINLNDPAIWYPDTKTLDLAGKSGGVLNFNSNPTGIQISNISSSSPAVITVDDASLIQEDSEVSPTLIQGGTEYTALNGNNYLAKNVDYVNNTFELYETDGTTPVDTISTGVVTNITNLIVGNPTSLEVAGAAGLNEMDLVEISGTGTLLDGNRYNIVNLNLGANTFEVFEDTTSETWNNSGTVTQITYDEETGEIAFTNGLKLEVESIVNVDNGVRFKFSASENNEITFTKTALSSAAAGDIVGSGTLVLSGKSQVMEMLRLKDLNYMKTEFEAS